MPLHLLIHPDLAEVEPILTTIYGETLFDMFIYTEIGEDVYSSSWPGPSSSQDDPNYGLFENMMKTQRSDVLHIRLVFDLEFLNQAVERGNAGSLFDAIHMDVQKKAANIRHTLEKQLLLRRTYKPTFQVPDAAEAWKWEIESGDYYGLRLALYGHKVSVFLDDTEIWLSVIQAGSGPNRKYATPRDLLRELKKQYLYRFQAVHNRANQILHSLDPNGQPKRFEMVIS